MCGRYTISKAVGVLDDYLGVEVSDDVELPIFNASPGQRLPVILDLEPGRIIPVLWGIKPRWPAAKSRLLINARAETVNERPTFKTSFQKRRCLVIADGFYEWQKIQGGKQPFRFTLKTGEPFAFAGIWQEIDGEPSYVILTTDANPVTRPIHERMPVILEANEHRPWLDHNVPIEDLLKLLDPYPEDAMMAYRVSKAVNNSRNQDSGLIEPVE
jgi:putative SOS response-associated peptidase YedK